MKIYYCSFSYWRSLSVTEKSLFTFLSTARTVPKDFNGIQFEEFTPSWNLFKEACKHFAQSNFEHRYASQIYNLNRTKILEKLNQLSLNKDIVFLVWEEDNKPSERDIFIPWLMQCNVKDLQAFSLKTELTYRKNFSNLFDL